MKFFVPSAFEKNTEAIKFQAAAQTASAAGSSKVKKNKKRKNKKKSSTTTAVNNEFQGKGPLAPQPMDADSDEDETMAKIRKIQGGKVEKKKNKKQKQQQQTQLKATPALGKAIDDAIRETSTTQITAAPPSDSVNSFQAKLKEQLMGGRFRFINEQLYTMDSLKAQNLFRQDPEAFTAYHEGYRHQVDKWPMNPLDRIIKKIKKLPKSLEIGDFGCGEGRLAKSVPHKVNSLDLVSCRSDIIACDMANTPLSTQSLDVAVYCLSLMGTNLKDYLLEANRVLKIDGLLLVAEIQSRFDNVKDFIKKVDSFGFQLIKQDVGQKLFYFFEFKKVRNIGKVANVPQLDLKPCLYRKR